MTLAGMLLVVAIGFALLNGANNGSSIVAIATSSTSLLPLTAIALLATSLVIGPLLFGTLVAVTLSTKLLDASGRSAEIAFLIGIVAAVAVIGLLAWRSLPSSLTLATIGGLAGSAIAARLPMNLGVVLLAIGLAVIVPLATGLVTFGVSRSLPVLLGAVGRQGLDRRQLSWFRRLSFVLQALAYATNDGQRMLAVLLVAIEAGWHSNHLSVPVDAAIAGAFAIGTVIGTGRMARGTPVQLAPASTFERSLASVMASIAAFLTSTLGVPVSMSQTTSAALVGAHTTSGKHRVRWEEAGKLLSAWAVTLPASAALGGLGTLAVLGAR